MFPIIPHQFFMKKSPVFLNNKNCGQNLNQLKVVANCKIELNTKSPKIKIEEIFEDNFSDNFEEVKLEINEENNLISNRKNWSWIKNMKLADDCHDISLILSNEECDKFVTLRAVKTINEDDNPTLWFSHQMLLYLQIPFLSPANIQGEKRYVCDKCGYEYEIPNPLKIHIALDCDRLPFEKMWNRLKNLIKQEKVIKNFEVKESELKLTPSMSAFKPYIKEEVIQNSIQDFKKQNPIFETQIVVPNEIIQSVTASQLNSSLYNQTTNLYNRRAAEMESIVSNLGRFKQGHLCIYCGKVYSRKYGLKIHIRTHTGFKPLKCKFCFRPFGDPSNLNKHVRLHSEAQTPYKCNLCGKLLVRKRDFDRHMKSRHHL